MTDESTAFANTRLRAPVKLVLFDFGLVLTAPPAAATWELMQSVSGLSQAALQSAYWAPRLLYDRGTCTGAVYWRHVAEQAGTQFTSTQIADLLRIDVLLWSQVNPPMLDWAKRLQAAGTRTAVLSNLGDAITQGVLRELPWLADFDALIWSHTLQLAKPEPAIYVHAAERLQLPSENILFIDDREDNVAAALAQGMQVIRYSVRSAEGLQFERILENHGFGCLYTTGADAKVGERSSL